MLERFTGDLRAVVVQAQTHARRLGHRRIGCEHLLLAAASAGGPAGAVLRDHGVTPQAVERQIAFLTASDRAADLVNGLDREALASIGIDLDTVRARIEGAFGPGALTRQGTARPPRPGHIPFTPRAKQSIARSLREAQARHDPQIGVEHLALALLATPDGAVPSILSALGASGTTLRSAMAERRRKAS